MEIIHNEPKAFKLTTFPQTRETALGDFSIFFRISDERLIIFGFCDNSQDPKSYCKY